MEQIILWGFLATVTLSTSDADKQLLYTSVQTKMITAPDSLTCEALRYKVISNRAQIDSFPLDLPGDKIAYFAYNIDVKYPSQPCVSFPVMRNSELVK